MFCADAVFGFRQQKVVPTSILAKSQTLKFIKNETSHVCYLKYWDTW